MNISPILVSMRTASAAIVVTFFQIRLRLTRRSEEPFEEMVLFTNADARPPEERGEIWWKFSKYTGYTIPERLYLPSESLLLLR